MSVGIVWGQKGGTGKSTTADALSRILAIDRRKLTFLIDLDGQGTNTDVHRIRTKNRDQTMYGVLGGQCTLQGAAVRKGDHLFVVPAHRDLYTWTYTEAGVDSLRRALASLQQRAEVIIDCGPAFTPLAKTALAAAEWLLIPCQPTETDLLSLGELKETILQLQREHVNDNLMISGVVLTRFRRQCNSHRDGLRHVQESAYPVLKTIIPESIAVDNATRIGQSVVHAQPWHKCARAYRALARELGL